MKRVFITILSLVLIALIFTSCSTITGALDNNEASYKEVIERFFNSSIQANVDDFLDSIDPSSPLYPSAEDIEYLRSIADEVAVPGEVVVRNLTVLEERTDEARVKAELSLRVDPYKTGEFQQQTGNLTFNLTLIDGKWRIFDYMPE